MAAITQTGRALTVTTPLGKDALFAVGFSGQEAISQLFRFQVDVIAEPKTAVPFDKLLGQPVSVSLAGGNKARHFHGICHRVSQGESDVEFTAYRLELVPKFWLSTKRAQSRIFQHKSVLDILKEVLTNLDVSFQLQGKYEPRDFCVQYRETDFNFASRVMEEEGIFYFFKHSAGGHQMVVADSPQAHPDLGEVTYAHPIAGGGQENAVFELGKTQELTAGKYTLWDHCFELPHKHLEADKQIQDNVPVGKVTHKLKVGDNGQLELYDWPGEYAQRFDGVDKGGGDRAADVQKIFKDNARTVGIRMEQEAATAVALRGAGNTALLVAGHKFTLKTLATDPVAVPLKADGPYVLTGVTHTARINGHYRSDAALGVTSATTFTCIPAGLPFRPQRATPKPVVPGSQTAVVVGPKGEEIFTDKYGRVKVQFHWDRKGEYNADSSCWVRVGTPWAGRRWGAVHIPRIGQEVIVDFLEGDPDQPIIVGSVYNADQMPPYLGDGPDRNHPKNPKLSGIKSNTTPGGDGFNELRFNDEKDKEQIFIHAERNMDQRVKNDSMERVLNDRHLVVGYEKDGSKVGDQLEQIYRDKHLRVNRNHIEHIDGNMELLVGKGEAPSGGNVDIVIEKDKKELIEMNDHLHVKMAQMVKVDMDASVEVGMNRNEKVGMNQSLEVGMSRHEKIGMSHAMEAGMTVHIKSGMTLVVEAGLQLSLKVGGSFIDINPAGVFIQGPLVMINSGGAAGAGSGAQPQAPQAPQDAKEAKPTEPTKADNAVTGKKSCD
jgi:type VI secretion system secreted protein VgrG